MRVVGYLRGPRPDGVDCERPMLVVCQHCPRRDVWACSGSRASRCRPCSGRYRRRVQSVAIEGMRRPGGFYYFLTLTAPGETVHHLPSGKRCRCTPPGGVDLQTWNPSASTRWNHLLVLIEREYSVRPRYFRVVETQQRGALHLHVLMWSPRKMTQKRLQTLGIRAGFGHSTVLDPIENAEGAAAYVTKDVMRVGGYVSKSADTRDLVPWRAEYVDHTTGEVKIGRTFARYRTWSQSRDWGTSMALIRRAAMDKAKQLQQLRDASVHSATVDVSASVPMTTGTSPPP